MQRGGTVPVSDIDEQIQRLQALRDSDALSDAEYEKEVAHLSGPGEDGESMSLLARIVASIVLLGVLAAAVYFTALWNGTDDARVEMANQQAPAIAVATAASPSSLEAPPADYLQLCIYSGFTPFGTRLSTMADFLVQQGRQVAWEASGADWILRTTWHDRLTGTDHQEAFQFQRRAGAVPGPACDRELGEVLLSRIARDGFETNELDPSLAPILQQDVGPPSNAVPATPVAVTEGAADDEDAIRNVPIVARYIALNERCRGGSGDNDATMQACEQRDAMAPEVERAGYCWGELSYQAEADKHWRRCSGR
jgi:hypothetical protein